MILHSTRAIIAAWLMIIAAALALLVASWSLLDADVYTAAVSSGTINEFLRYGSIAQDIITLPLAAFLLLAGISFLSTGELRSFIVMLGLVSYLFYGYGLYVMQGQYTTAYPGYMAIFGLSVYGLITGFSSIRRQFIPAQVLSAPLRIAIAVFLSAILLVLVPVWLMLLLPAVAAHQPADTYAVFVLDLCIVFPGLAVIVYLLFRNKPLGSIWAGIALVKAFTVCLSVAFGEYYGPATRQLDINAANLGIFGTLTVVSAGLLLGYFMQARFTESSRPRRATKPLAITHEL